MPLQWTPDLALGIPELDGQHLQIDAHLRVLHDAVCAGRVPDVAAVLAGLREATERHFRAEEQLMAAKGYPALESHRAEHGRFGERAAAFEAACRRDGATMRLAIELAGWLATWLREHQRLDLDLRSHVAPERTTSGG